MMSSLRDYRKNTKRQRTNAKRPTFWAIEIPVCVGEPVVGLRRRNRPAVGYPPYVCRHVLAFSSNLFGSITHRGGRDARVPVRCRYAAIVCLSADIGRFGFGGACWIPFGFCPFRAGGIWGRFSQGVALCYGLFAPLGRVFFMPRSGNGLERGRPARLC
ncbi:MAG: hypothetical protein LBQ66_11445, partial [Planctomycetaceae bacterium]|nr:hypothetical protein [Planctomycetaceae bacterium]